MVFDNIDDDIVGFDMIFAEGLEIEHNYIQRAGFVVVLQMNQRSYSIMMRTSLVGDHFHSKIMEQYVVVLPTIILGSDRGK